MAEKAKPSRSRIRLREMTIKIMNKRASTRKAEGEKKRELEQELAQLLLDKETFKGLSNSIRNAEGENKQKLEQEGAFRTLAVYPVVPNSPVLPGWVHSVHTSHQVVLVGGLVGCLRCGWIVSRMGAYTFTVKKPCAGRRTSSTSLARRWQMLSQGSLPFSYYQWPDELAAPRDVRPVDRLRHSGSEWVLDSQVRVRVFTSGSGDCCDRRKPGVSWDPYSPSARAE